MIIVLSSDSYGVGAGIQGERKLPVQGGRIQGGCWPVPQGTPLYEGINHP